MAIDAQLSASSFPFIITKEKLARLTRVVTGHRLDADSVIREYFDRLCFALLCSVCVWEEGGREGGKGTNVDFATNSKTHTRRQTDTLTQWRRARTHFLYSFRRRLDPFFLSFFFFFFYQDTFLFLLVCACVCVNSFISVSVVRERRGRDEQTKRRVQRKRKRNLCCCCCPSLIEEGSSCSCFSSPPSFYLLI